MFGYIIECGHICHWPYFKWKSSESLNVENKGVRLVQKLWCIAMNHLIQQSNRLVQIALMYCQYEEIELGKSCALREI